MNLEKVSYSGKPATIVEAAFDCIWITFAERASPSPLRSPALQWLDWKLQGQISRYLLSDFEGSAKMTFVPTMKRLPTPYVALQPEAKLDWRPLVARCEGLKIRRVLYFCEDGAKVRELERELSQCPDASFPETVILGSDS